MTIEELYDLFDDNWTELNTQGHYTSTDECKAISMVLNVIKELQAHKKAWEKAKRTVKAYLMLEWFGSAYQDDIEKLIEECIPKEGDGNASAD